MNQDLKIIKNKYGENMMHLCRELFPTILEKEGVLSQILLDIFEPSKFLYEDIIEYELKEKFKNYIYKIFDPLFKEEKIKIEKTPEELLYEAGYILYECKTEKDIQSFRKYYKKDEELCTFNDDRLDRCYVYFAVKKDVNNIKRKKFTKPERQDLYGTSVISIQFTKDESHVLSIKNRYNHTVKNPDATFGNNLDNIIPGLTDSFEKYYGMKQKVKSSKFEIPGYVMANNGKYYKYNMEINNKYYCPDNIIIDNFEVKRYPKEKYIVLDYFILDLKTGKIKLYDKYITDCLPNTIGDYNKFEIKKEGDYKKIIFYIEEKEPIVIIIDKLNNVVALKNNNIKEISHGFLYYNRKLEKLNLDNVEFINGCFLFSNNALRKLKLPKVKVIGDYCLNNNKKMEELKLPNLVVIKSKFLQENTELRELDLPMVKIIGDEFLNYNEKLEKLSFPNVETIEDSFLFYNTELKELYLPNAYRIGSCFLYNNKKLEKLIVPNLQYIEDSVLSNNRKLKELCLPQVLEIGFDFLYRNQILEKIILPNVENINEGFLYKNMELKELELPNVCRIGKNFLYYNKKLEKFNLANLNYIYEDSLYNNEALKELDLPKVLHIGENFLYKNNIIEKIVVKGSTNFPDYIKDKVIRLKR